MNLRRFFPSRSVQSSAARPSARAGLRFYLGLVVALVVGLLASLYFFFPTSALEERIEFEIETRTPATADLRTLALSFPPALRAEALQLTVDEPQPVAVTLTDPAVRPLWHSLLGSNPGVAVRAGLLGGRSEGTIRRDGAMNVNVSEIRFDAPVPTLTSLRLSGQLSAGELSSAAPIRPTTESQLKVVIENVALSGLQALGMSKDALSLGAITLRAEGKGNAFRIGQLESRGGDFTISGGGTVLLGRRIEQSRLNLNVALKAEPTLDKDMADMLGMLRQPSGDGTYRFRISGSVMRPQAN